MHDFISRLRTSDSYQAMLDVDYTNNNLDARASVKIDARRMSAILNYSQISLISAVLCETFLCCIDIPLFTLAAHCRLE